MNPNRGEPTPSIEIRPDPQSEVGGEIDDNRAETAAAVEMAPAKQSAPVIASDSTDMALAAASTPIPADDTDEDQGPSAGAAGQKDSARMERQWVDRAKLIVSETEDDPFKQKNEMSKVKAEYIKQRFNKVIKTDAEAA